MKKTFIIGFLLLSLIFSGCSNTSGVAVIGDDSSFQSHEEAKIHSGDMYATRTTVNVGAGSTVYLKGVAEMPVHLLQRRVYAETSGVSLDYEIKLYEGGTDTGASTVLDTFNLNRELGYTNSTFNIYTSVTGVNLATATELPFGNKELSDKKYSSTSVSTTEYILKANQDYYLAITNNDGGILEVSLFWEFYEE